MRRFRSSFVLWPGLAIVGLSLFGRVASRARSDTTVAVQGRLLDEIKYLASDELEGRGIGTQGLNKAADFIRRNFQSAGLDVTRIKGGAFQTFSMSAKVELGSPNSLRVMTANDKVIELKQDVDFRTCSFGGSGKIEGEIAFAGYGIDSAEQKYQDFKGLDAKGKVVIVVRRVPRQGDPRGPFSGPHHDIGRAGDLQSKLSNAIAAGASALIVVNDWHTLHKNANDTDELIRKSTERLVAAAEAFDAAKPDSTRFKELRKDLADAISQLRKARQEAAKSDDDLFMPFGYGGYGKEASIPVVQMKAAACDRLVKEALGKTLAQLEEAIDRDLKPHSAVLTRWRAEGVTTIRRIPAEVKNVIGVLEGEGPLANQTVVLGAHYDHLGRGGLGSLAGTSHEIHNGADDNASGAAALLELAHRFGQRAKKLPRRLVFIAFTAEEEGLIGSARYIKDPLFPLETTVAMINLDMVGRLSNDKLTVFGVGTSDRWKDLLGPLAQSQHLKLINKPEGFGPSDQSSFYAKKIPVLHFFTGTHSDYHRPSDDWEKINIPGMCRVINMVDEVVTAVAQSPKRPDYVEVKERAQVARTGSRPYFGSIPDFSTEDPGYAISGVAPGSPADLGGLKGGDRIVEFGGRKITGLDDFDLALRKFASGDEVGVAVMRGAKRLGLKVVLGKPK